MTLLKVDTIGVILLAATAVASAQTKFPMHAGEWETTTPSTLPNQPPMVLPYCLNDELWTKALTQNPACSIQRLSVTSTGASYFIDCPMKGFQMKGPVDIKFDGMTHMVGKGSFDMVIDGKASHMDSQTDYRWKGPTCNPDKDVNLKFKAH
jgi:hypothetical protein